MLMTLQRLVRRFKGAESGVSAVEFALIAPVMVTMLLGTIELSGGITASNRATYVADQLGEMVSRTTGTISTKDMTGFIESASLVDPDIIKYAKASGKPLIEAANVNISSVQFFLADKKCKSNCKYDAHVVFSAALAGPKRSCGKLSPGSGYSPATLPADVYSPGSLVVVDVETFYKPMVMLFLGETISFKRSAYFRPRDVPRVNYIFNCPGFLPF